MNDDELDEIFSGFGQIIQKYMPQYLNTNSNTPTLDMLVKQWDDEDELGLEIEAASKTRSDFKDHNINYFGKMCSTTTTGRNAFYYYIKQTLHTLYKEPANNIHGNISRVDEFKSIVLSGDEIAKYATKANELLRIIYYWKDNIAGKSDNGGNLFAIYKNEEDILDREFLRVIYHHQRDFSTMFRNNEGTKAMMKYQPAVANFVEYKSYLSFVTEYTASFLKALTSVLNFHVYNDASINKNGNLVTHNTRNSLTESDFLYVLNNANFADIQTIIYEYETGMKKFIDNVRFTGFDNIVENTKHINDIADADLPVYRSLETRFIERSYLAFTCDSFTQFNRDFATHKLEVRPTKFTMYSIINLDMCSRLLTSVEFDWTRDIKTQLVQFDERTKISTPENLRAFYCVQTYDAYRLGITISAVNKHKAGYIFPKSEIIPIVVDWKLKTVEYTFATDSPRIFVTGTKRNKSDAPRMSKSSMYENIDDVYDLFDNTSELNKNWDMVRRTTENLRNIT